jgi:hypothetical protein
MQLGMTTSGQYGQYTYNTKIGFVLPSTSAKKNIIIKACIYGTAATALTPDKVYTLQGRLIAWNKKKSPLIFFKQDLTLHIGDSNTYMASLANKVAVSGTGIVVHREEVEGPGSYGNTVQTNLHVTLKHKDYDNNVSAS